MANVIMIEQATASVPIVFRAPHQIPRVVTIGLAAGGASVPTEGQLFPRGTAPNL